eukprot:6311-Heterococcus_DN1.PRE.4
MVELKAPAFEPATARRPAAAKEIAATNPTAKNTKDPAAEMPAARPAAEMPAAQPAAKPAAKELTAKELSATKPAAKPAAKEPATKPVAKELRAKELPARELPAKPAVKAAAKELPGRELPAKPAAQEPAAMPAAKELPAKDLPAKPAAKPTARELPTKPAAREPAAKGLAAREPAAMPAAKELPAKPAAKPATKPAATKPAATKPAAQVPAATKPAAKPAATEAAAKEPESESEPEPTGNKPFCMPEPEDECDETEDERMRCNAADVVSADSEELEIPVVDEKERDLTPATQPSDGKSRHYWLQVKLFQIHDRARQTSILDSIKVALKTVHAIGYMGVQKGRVQHSQHGHRLYYMLLLKQTNRNTTLTQTAVKKALANTDTLTPNEKAIITLGVLKGRKAHTKMRKLYSIEEEEEEAKVEAQLQPQDEDLYSEHQRGEKRKWAEFEYNLAHEIQDKAEALFECEDVSMEECVERVKKQLKCDTGAVFMTKGQAVTEVLEKEPSFSGIPDMSTIISKFWRTKPEYDNERFNHDVGEATKAEMSAFKTAEQSHIADLEARLGASLRDCGGAVFGGGEANSASYNFGSVAVSGALVAITESSVTLRDKDATCGEAVAAHDEQFQVQQDGATSDAAPAAHDEQVQLPDDQQHEYHCMTTIVTAVTTPQQMNAEAVSNAAHRLLPLQTDKLYNAWCALDNVFTVYLENKELWRDTLEDAIDASKGCRILACNFRTPNLKLWWEYIYADIIEHYKKYDTEAVKPIMCLMSCTAITEPLHVLQSLLTAVGVGEAHSKCSIEQCLAELETSLLHCSSSSKLILVLHHMHRLAELGEAGPMSRLILVGLTSQAALPLSIQQPTQEENYVKLVKLTDIQGAQTETLVQAPVDGILVPTASRIVRQ